MSKEIVVNVGIRETRVAVVESGKLTELHVEREEQVAGSIYKSKVANVLPGMDAAFVDIGLDRNAFLYAGDVLPEAGDEVPAVKKESSRNVNIKDLLKVGQEVLVQVVKALEARKARGYRRGCRCQVDTWY